MVERQKVYGVVVAIVAGPAEASKEGHRVKVKFRSLPEGAEPSEASHNCLVATGFMPGANDEVLVAFENGNIDRPFIVGAVSNNKALVAVQFDQIEIFDSRNENYVLLDTKNKKITIESRSGDMVLKAKNVLRIEAKYIDINAGEVNTKAGFVHTKANDVAFNASRYVTLNGMSGVSVTSSSGVTLTSSSSISVSSAGVMTIKGSTVNIN